MARRHHRRHHRRHYGSQVTIPFAGALDVLKSNVKGTDVVVGALLGLAGSGLAKAAANKLMPSGLPAIVSQFWPVVGSALAGTALYMMEKKGNKSRAEGHLLGALTAGVGVSAWSMLQAQFPDSFSDVVALRYSGYRGYQGYPGYGSVLINDQARAPYGSLIVNDSPRQLSDANLAQLGAIAMGDGDDEGLAALMEN
jgi:hypothetical protein